MNQKKTNIESDPITPLDKKRGINKLFEQLTNYCKQNEEAHLESPSGWGYYVQNLYLSVRRDDRY